MNFEFPLIFPALDLLVQKIKERENSIFFVIFFTLFFYILPWYFRLLLWLQALDLQWFTKTSQLYFFFLSEFSSSNEKMQKLKSLTVSNLRHLLRNAWVSDTFIMAYLVVSRYMYLDVYHIFHCFACYAYCHRTQGYIRIKRHSI